MKGQKTKATTNTSNIFFVMELPALPGEWRVSDHLPESHHKWEREKKIEVWLRQRLRAYRRLPERHASAFPVAIGSGSRMVQRKSKILQAKEKRWMQTSRRYASRPHERETPWQLLLKPRG